MRAEPSECLFPVVAKQLLELVPDGHTVSPILAESLLLEDIGLDSLKMVELTVRLEQVLGIDGFPMQRWVDDQIVRYEPLTVGALVAECSKLLQCQS